MNNSFMMSNMPYGTMMGNNPIMSGGTMMRSAPMMAGSPMIRGAARGGGLSSLLGLGGRSGGGLMAGSRSINFAGLLNNASKALGVVNQAIPIVKEVGPMVGNMKSMLKIASVFKDETDINLRSTTNENTSTKENRNIIETSNVKENDTSITSTNISRSSFNNEPNFFL